MDELYNVFTEYLNTYLIKRDINGIIDLLSKDVTCFGTGIDEVAYDFDTLKKLFIRDIEQAPNKVDYEIKNLKISMPADNVGIVACEINFKTIILNQEFKYNNLRLSLVFVKKDNKWLIEHNHISLPTVEQEEGEAYPIKELEERNKVLQRLVEERTEELKKVNEELMNKIEEIKTLRGLLPICVSCKKIKDPEGKWHQIEAYITRKTEAKFSHGLCEECAKKLYPEVFNDE